jgi:hypothetical protein
MSHGFSRFEKTKTSKKNKTLWEEENQEKCRVESREGNGGGIQSTL